MKAVCSRGPSGEEARIHEHHGRCIPWQLPVIQLPVMPVLLLLMGSL